jgi:hypothetical protein
MCVYTRAAVCYNFSICIIKEGVQGQFLSDITSDLHHLEHEGMPSKFRIRQTLSDKDLDIYDFLLALCNKTEFESAVYFK